MGFEQCNAWRESAGSGGVQGLQALSISIFGKKCVVCCHFLPLCWGSLLAHTHRASRGALGFPLPPLPGSSRGDTGTPQSCELPDEWEQRIFYLIRCSFFSPFHLFTKFFYAALTRFHPHTPLCLIQFPATTTQSLAVKGKM